MKTKIIRTTLALLVIALLIIGIKFVTTVGDGEGRVRTYINEVYGYQFNFDDVTQIRQSTPENVVVGEIVNGFFRAEVLVEVFSQGPTETFSTYEEFIAARVQALCAVDSPDFSVECKEIEEQEEFTTSEGLAGTAFYVTQTITTTAGETTVVAKGPIYAFPLSDDPTDLYQSLVLYTPVFGSEDNGDISLLQTTAESLEIGENSSAQEEL